MRFIKRTVVLLVLLFLGMGIIGFLVSSHSAPASDSKASLNAQYAADAANEKAESQQQAKPDVPDWDKSAATQQKREDLIGQLQDRDIIGDVNQNGNEATVVIEPAFYDLEFTRKQEFASMIFAWCFDHIYVDYVPNKLRLIDSKTGKEAGLFKGGKLSMD